MAFLSYLLQVAMVLVLVILGSSPPKSNMGLTALLVGVFLLGFSFLILFRRRKRLAGRSREERLLAKELDRFKKEGVHLEFWDITGLSIETVSDQSRTVCIATRKGSMHRFAYTKLFNWKTDLDSAVSKLINSIGTALQRQPGRKLVLLNPTAWRVERVVQCPGCQHVFNVQGEDVGKVCACAKCRHRVAVPVF
jgi:hypothetical protein